MPSAVALGESTTMKLTFTVVDTSSSQAVFPQQAHLLFEDPKGGDVTLPVTVKSNGKASFTIVRRIPFLSIRLASKQLY